MRYLLWKLGLAEVVRLRRYDECRVRLIRYKPNGTKYVRVSDDKYTYKESTGQFVSTYYTNFTSEPYKGVEWRYPNWLKPNWLKPNDKATKELK
jgi:hypothetical protein